MIVGPPIAANIDLLRNQRDSAFRPQRSRVHPDDALKKLAKHGRVVTGPTIYREPKRPLDRFRATAILVVGVVLLLGGMVSLPFLLPHTQILVTGLDRVTYLTPSSLGTKPIYFTTKPVSGLKDLRIRIDGRPASVVRERTKLRWVPDNAFMGEGKHRVVLESGGRFLWRGATRKSFTVVVDSVPPMLTVKTQPEGSASKAGDEVALTVRGTVEKSANLQINGVKVAVADGAFRYRFARPPIGAVRVIATDLAGNATEMEVRSNVAAPQFRGIYLSSKSIRSESVKDLAFSLGAAGKINTVVLDLKDEQGVVGYRSSLGRVADVGANDACSTGGCYDLLSVIAEMHRHGLRVIGRIVTFRDPLFVRSALSSQRLGEVTQNADGTPFVGSYGGFANPVSEAAQNYVLDIAQEAAKLGIDDILLDYVRRPDGDFASMKFVGLDPPTIEGFHGAVQAFLGKAAERLAGTKARLGVTVFGIAARNPNETGQDIRSIARLVDYVAPTVYPSSWRSGYYNLVDPPNNPYEIVFRAVNDFQKQVAGTDAVVVPWLQDFTPPGSRTFGTKQVQLQIQGAQAALADAFLLFDPKGSYSTAAIPNDAPLLHVPKPEVPAGPAPTIASTVPATISSTKTPVP